MRLRKNDEGTSGVANETRQNSEETSGVAAVPSMRTRSRVNLNEQTCGSLDGDFVDDELEDVSYGSSDEYNEVRGRYKDFNAERDMTKPQFEIGRRLKNGDEFREGVRNFCNNDGKSVRFKPSESTRIWARCRTEICDWNILALVEVATKSKDFVIKNLEAEA